MRIYRFVVIAVAALCVGLVLHASGNLRVDAGTWAAAPAMNTARTGAASVLMPDGRILITGGTDANGNPLSSAEFFNSDGSFSDAPAMASPRAGHAAVWLPTGYVLVVGGTAPGGGVTNTAELFDPLSNQWTTLSSTMVEPRTDFTTTVLRFGNVVIAGGTHAGVPVSTVEVFDISAETFSSIGALGTARANAAAATISDFKVLVAGGSDVNGATLASTEIIDTEHGSITAGPALSSPRQSASATALLDGSVIIAGGSYPENIAANGGVAELASTDIYDPASGVIASGPTMSAPRAAHQAFLLPSNNNVLFVGGVAAGQDLSSVDLYTPWTGTFAAQASMSAARKQGTGSAAYSSAFRSGNDGVLFVAGGSNEASAELYGFATVKTDADDYAPGTPVIITGSGWVPGETVTLSLLEYPNLDTHTLAPVTADANGNIYSAEFAPDANDLNIKFYMTATGSRSSAQNVFTDSVTSVTITSVSPSSTIVALPATVTVNFSYVTSTTGATTAQLDLSGTALTANKNITPGAGSDSLSITIPAGTANGSYNAKVTVSNSTGTGANNKNDTMNGAFVINVPLNISTSTVITSSSATPKYGDSLTFTATVSPASGSVAPTGTVAMKVDGASVTATTSTSGNTLRATFSTSALAAGNHTVDAAYSATGNFNSSTASQFTQNVGKATLTVTADDKSMAFGGSVPTLTYTPTGFKNGDGAGVLTGSPALSTTATSSSSPGDYPITAAAGTLAAVNYTFTFVNGKLTIGKADVTVAWSNTSATYDGSPKAITAMPTPSVAGLIITYTGTDNGGASYNSTTEPTNAGSYTATATLSDTTDYKFAAAAQTSSPFTINRTDANVSVSGYTGTYDAAAHGASGTATGVGGVDLSAGLSLGATFTDVPGGTAHWSFSGGTNYNDQSGTAAIVINKADATVTVNDYTGTYDAAAHGATGTATGVGGADLHASLSLGATFTDVPGGSAHWTFSGGTNYNDQSGTAAIVISKADATVTVNGYTGTYDAAAHGATGTATGVGGVSLPGLSLGSSFTNVPGGTAHWAFSGGTNYNDQSGDVGIVISKATPTVHVADVNTTYDGNPHPAAGSVTGVSGADLGASTIAYNPGGSTAPVNAGSYAVTASYPGSGNYEAASANATVTIAKASSTTVVTFEVGPYIYRGNAFTATAMATGAGGLNQPLTPSYSGDCINVTIANGCSAAASYIGDTNHDPSDSSSSITIQKATPVVHVSGITVVYDANPHPVTGSVTGVGGADLGAVTILYTPGGSTAPVGAGSYTVLASYAGSTNYNPATANATITINKADAIITVTGYNVIFDNALHTATGSAKGVLGESLSGLDLSNTAHKLVGTYNDLWSFTDSTGNYNNASDHVIDTIGAWTLSGFYQPVTTYTGALVWNTVKAGSTVPLKFNIYAGTIQRTDVASVVGQSVAVYAINSCSVGIDESVDYVVNTGSTLLRFDAGGAQFIQNWQTPKGANQCYLVRMTALDGSKLEAYFKTK